MKQMKTIRSLIVLLTAICFGLAVIAFFLPHGIGTVCAIGTVALAALVLILCLVYGALYLASAASPPNRFFHLSAFLFFQKKAPQVYLWVSVKQ